MKNKGWRAKPQKIFQAKSNPQTLNNSALKTQSPSHNNFNPRESFFVPFLPAINLRRINFSGRISSFAGPEADGERFGGAEMTESAEHRTENVEDGREFVARALKPTCSMTSLMCQHSFGHFQSPMRFIGDCAPPARIESTRMVGTLSFISRLGQMPFLSLRDHSESVLEGNVNKTSHNSAFSANNRYKGPAIAATCMAQIDFFPTFPAFPRSTPDDDTSWPVNTQESSCD